MSNLLRSASTTLLGLTAAVAGGALVLAGPAATAAAPAPSTVTIQAEGTDLFGNVSSSRAVCEADRNVVVYKQIGVRGGGNDIRFAMDTTESDGDWNTGNTGTEGKFYAKVKKNAQCKADFSPTIRATR
jgi:hypothetical protein